MKYIDRSTVIVTLVTALIVLAILAVSFFWQWYRAGVQRDVYARQGVRMSQWEVFVGAKPIVRQIVGDTP